MVLFLAYHVTDFSGSNDELKRGAEVLSAKIQYIQSDLKKRFSEQIILPGDSQKKINRQLFQTIESWLTSS